MESFDIVLDKPEGTFSAGEIVSGRVIVDLSRPKIIRGLKLRIKGVADVKWTESGFGDSEDDYRAHEQYFKMDSWFLGGSATQTVVMEPGHQEFPFSMCLPSNIPNSFDSTGGHVRYSIKAVVERPCKFNLTTTMAFTVQTPYDISHCPDAMDQIEHEEIKSFCCFPWFEMGSMKVTLHVPRKGYSVGDTISARISVQNKASSVNVKKVECFIDRKVDMHSSRPSKTHTRFEEVAKASKKGPFSKNTDFIMNIQVPEVIPSDLQYCSIIDIGYRINYKISVSGCHCAARCSLPIFIGSKLMPTNFDQTGSPRPSGIVDLLPVLRISSQSNGPSAPFDNENSTATGNVPFPLPMQMPMVNQTTFPVPYPTVSANKVPVDYLPHNPPTVNHGVSFVYTRSSVTSCTEPLPPSYDTCQLLEEKK